MFDQHRPLADTAGGDAILALGKSAPSLTAVGLTMAGIGLQDWLAICGILFILLQAAHLTWKWWREVRSGPGRGGW